MTRMLSLLVFGALLTLPSTAADLPRPAGDLTFTAMDGKQVSLKDLRGKVVAVMFFSTDCPHCQNAAETLAPLYAALKPKGLEVLGLALNEPSPQQLRQFAENHQARFPLGVSNFEQFSGFAQWSLMKRFYYPFLMVVDRKGMVRAIHEGAERAWFNNLAQNAGALFEKLLAEPPGS